MWYRENGDKDAVRLEKSFLHFQEMFQIRMEQAFNFYFYRELKGRNTAHSDEGVFKVTREVDK